MLGVGFRQEMRDWQLDLFPHQFVEVAPENWVRKDLTPLKRLGKPIAFHGVSLNLGGETPIDIEFLRLVRSAMNDLNITFYSDHLAASGDAHQLYDLFPIPFTKQESGRVANRIKAVQDVLGCQMAIENSVYYTNVGELSEMDFLNEVLERADCLHLLDVNNLVVNDKNHHTGVDLTQINWDRVTYVHVAGHEYSSRFDLYWDTHSARAEPAVLELAREAYQRKKAILLEWDNAIPDQDTYKNYLLELQQCFVNGFGTTSAA